MGKSESDRNVQVRNHILGTFVTNLLVHIRQKEKVAAEMKCDIVFKVPMARMFVWYFLDWNAKIIKIHNITSLVEFL